MRLWLVKTGEPWPTDGQHVRLGRTGIIAQNYARKGDNVVWFNEVFSHRDRCHLHEREENGAPEPNLSIVALKGRGYRRSVSLSRMLHHGDVARDFRIRAASYERPDMIVSSLIPLELCREMVRYGQNNDVPVVVDVRDLWPEIWLDLVPRPLRPVARQALHPYFRMLTEIVDGSDAICGISEDAVDWALSHGNRARNSFDGALPLAYEPPELTDSERADAGRFWSARGIERDETKLTICYFGTLSRRIELDTIVRAGERAPADLRNRLRIVFCGRGEVEAKISEAARDSPIIHFAGWVNAAQIEALKQRSDIGLLPYPSSMDFVRSMPNKVFDYLSGGLPMLTCLKGVVGRLVAETGCGWMYENDDPESFLQTVGPLIGNRDAIAQAAASADRVGAQFSASEIYGQFRNRLRAICATSPGRQARGEIAVRAEQC